MNEIRLVEDVKEGDGLTRYHEMLNDVIIGTWIRNKDKLSYTDYAGNVWTQKRIVFACGLSMVFEEHTSEFNQKDDK